MTRPEPLKSTFVTLILLAALVQIAGVPVEAAAASLNKEQAEARLLEINRDISALKNRLESSRADQHREQLQLKQLDLAIQQASLKYRELEQQRDTYMAELAGLERQREDYLASLGERFDQLAQQINAAYRAAGQTRLKLVLNQDDPQEMGRMLAYYDYLNRAQVDKIAGLKEALTTLDGMQQSIDRELQLIDSVQTEQQTVLDDLEEQRQNRNALLAQLSRQISSEESRLAELQQNQRDLEALLERLSDVLADIPPDLGSRSGVAARKGRIAMPVRGPVRHAYGQRRVGGMKWQGWLIGAERGSEVTAVAYGRVAFADWLRGYGLLLIIDHGQGFLSLYGHNESLLQDVGSWVEPGQVISVVGENPGGGQGLYFELRKNGKAVDPAAWLAR
ncbi:MAG: peptidoglycan DD-metalloendopeptidase family protein [Xanthomonadales bacterium]|nr:peptidoglycan DD-metalloendopeptidase family protein [Xanthomonadales bacterium]MDH3924177.1 peptidoglycan DD-metalloendopeptidase family protein [Xanthomonadales bacterium]MDH3940954.1 peptidoglycan DD-metalloendopeptidase family protein [Xanthomonadales bacterium]MDH4000877.1 peptidoglycan DD-metalloendopeptidase family protein [Xanthomonadales bacterium]